jgi:hypothetical protein
MALDFPASPTNGQTFTSGGVTWQWDGSKWIVLPGSGGGAMLPITGGTLQGPLILAADPLPTAPLGAATKQYADAGSAAAEHNVGRSYIHNGLFNVLQRGFGPWTVAGYTADRWRMNISGDTINTGIAAQNDAGRAQIGDEASRYAISLGITGNATAGAYSALTQPIEGVQRLSGKTVTISFYAYCPTAHQIGVNILQNFGTGGSPSAQAWALASGLAVAIGPSWTRYSVTIPMPSAAGKTLGTNGDDSNVLWLWLSSGATNNANAGNIGVQSGTVNLWGVQLELGGTATPLEKLDPRLDLANCQRFYQVGNLLFNGYQSAGHAVSASNMLPVQMRAAPTIAFNGTTSANLSNIGAGSQTFSVWVTANTVASGDWQMLTNFTASADL